MFEYTAKFYLLPFVSTDNWKSQLPLFLSVPVFTLTDRHAMALFVQMPAERKPLANDRSPVFFFPPTIAPPLLDLDLIRHTGEMEYMMSTRHSCFRPASIIGNRWYFENDGQNAANVTM